MSEEQQTEQTEKPAAPAVFDLDEGAVEFEPVRIRVKGKEYQLPESGAALLSTLAALEDVSEEPGLDELMPLYGNLAPSAPKFEQLSVGQQMALVKPVTEVLRRICAISFREA